MPCLSVSSHANHCCFLSIFASTPLAAAVAPPADRRVFDNSCAPCQYSGDENVIAVDPDENPIGSEVHVEGYGDAVAADTGGDINGDRVDLHMGEEDEANEWGRQDVEVTVK